MASKQYEKTVKTGFWKQSRNQKWADKAKESYEKISQRATVLK
jgi:hypothetical protein